MGIERLYADQIEQAYQRGLREPAAPAEAGFRAGSFLAAGFGGLATGLLEQGASFLEGVGSFTALGNKRFAEMGAKTTDTERAKEVQRGLDAAGRAARMRAQESAPDPQTTHMADQVFHGLTRFGSKAVGSVVAAGPVGGAALLGTEEANTIYRDLTARGIDSETALKVAAVQGAISAAGVVIPISGAGMAATTAGKVAATAGLVAAGGPASYAVQEKLARDILQRAGYADEAAKHDPTDPLGLAISTILPAAFGGAALRGALRTPKQIGPIKTEAGVRDAVQLTPEEQTASAEFERSVGNLAELRQEIARTKDPASRHILEAELAKQTEAAANAGRGAVAEAVARSPEVVDAARVKVLQETVRRSLPDHPDAVPRLMEVIDSLSAGERPAIEPPAIPQVRALEQQIADFEADRAELLPTAGQLADRGEIAPIRQELALLEQNRPASTEPDIKALAKRIQEAEGVSYKTALSKAKKQTTDAVSDFEARVGRLEDAIRRNAEGQQAAERLSVIDDQIAAARQQIEELAPFSAFRTPVAEAARQALFEPVARRPEVAAPQQMQPADPLTARTDAPTPPQAPYPEAAAPARGAGDAPGPVATDAGRPAADVQAAGVERKVADQERQIVEALATEKPDMMVTLPGTNEAVRLSDAVEMIRAQQALDESDADLVRAAVLCDLSP